MKEYDLIKDFSVISTVKESDLNLMTDKMVDIISHSLVSSLYDKETMNIFSIGDLGKISIKIEEDEIVYKFTPSNKLIESNKQAVKNKKSPLIENIKEKIAKRLFVAYKELL